MTDQEFEVYRKNLRDLVHPQRRFMRIGREDLADMIRSIRDITYSILESEGRHLELGQKPKELSEIKD